MASPSGLRAEPTVSQEIADHRAQLERLAAFLSANPFVIWTQETLAERCGADVGAVRTRISELRKDEIWRRDLRGHSGSYIGTDGKSHRGKKRWEYVPKQHDPIGPPADEYRPGPTYHDQPLFQEQ